MAPIVLSWLAAASITATTGPAASAPEHAVLLKPGAAGAAIMAPSEGRRPGGFARTVVVERRQDGVTAAAREAARLRPSALAFNPARDPAAPDPIGDQISRVLNPR